jgi:uncharacterized membrane protein
MTGLHDFARPDPQSWRGRETNAALRRFGLDARTEGGLLMNILTIVVVVLIVLFVVGYFGRGRFRA